jgi:hypothetical protein
MDLEKFENCPWFLYFVHGVCKLLSCTDLYSTTAQINHPCDPIATDDLKQSKQLVVIEIVYVFILIKLLQFCTRNCHSKRLICVVII